jgi:uncharacterized damage-inducible protein DinB
MIAVTEQKRDAEALLARYADGPGQLEAAIAGLSEGDLDLALTAESWTIRQIVHHVVDGDDLWKACVKAALGDSRELFSFRWYWDTPQDEWAERWDYAGRAIEPSLALFRACRRHIVQLLQQIPDPWERYALIMLPNGEERPASVGYVVEMQVDHVTAHINDIRMIRQTHGV